jgi:hypothetical protein
MDDVEESDVMELCSAYGVESVGEHSAKEIIRRTGGNFALMEKLLTLAQGDTQR